MSRRSFPQYLAAGLLAAAVSPALAQPPSPWRVGVEVAPAPRPVGQRVQVVPAFNFTVPQLGSARATKPARTAHEFAFLIETVRSAPAPTSQLAPACCESPATGKLSGTYYRELPGAVASLTFRGSEAKAVVNVNTGGTAGTITLTAHYAVTSEGTVHGVITGADVNVGSNPAAGVELAPVAVEIQQYVDHPFAFRARTTDGGLMIAGLKVAGPALDSLMLPGFAGMFKTATDGKVPVVKPMNGACIPGCAGDIRVQAVAPPGVTFIPSGQPCPTSPPGAPADVGDAMVRTFQQMFGAAGGGMTLPSPRYLQLPPQYILPSPDFPLMRELPTQVPCPPMPVGQPVPCPTPVPCPPTVGQWTAYPVAVPLTPAGFVPPPPPALPPMVAPVRPVGSAPVGMWYREVGAMMYTVVVKDNHVTITSKMALELDGKTVTQGVVLTGDYHVTRDGSNLLGVVTAVDVVIEGTLPEGTQSDEVPKLVTKLQKAMTDKPFALSFRVYDNTLVLGNVRLPACEDGDLAAAMESMGGRYTAAGDKPLPKPKAVKVGPPLEKYTKPPVRVSGANSYSADPNVRISQLLHQSEDLRQIGQEWRRFWFNDQPQHLTPERVHGMIR